MLARSQPKCRPTQFFLYGLAGPLSPSPPSPPVHLPFSQVPPFLQSLSLSHCDASQFPATQARPVSQQLFGPHLPPQPPQAPPGPSPSPTPQRAGGSSSGNAGGSAAVSETISMVFGLSLDPNLTATSLSLSKPST